MFILARTAVLLATSIQRSFSGSKTSKARDDCKSMISVPVGITSFDFDLFPVYAVILH